MKFSWWRGGLLGAVCLGALGWAAVGYAWEGDREGDGDLFSTPEEYAEVIARDWKEECVDAGSSVTSRNAFCSSLPLWWTGSRGRCWSHVYDSGSGWPNWCNEEFGSPW